MPVVEELFLRLCGRGDAEALSRVGAATFLESFAGMLDGPDILAHCRVHHAEAQYALWLGDPAYRIAVAELRGAPVGFVVLSPPDLPVATTDADLELKRIYVLHRFHGRGLGRRLLTWAAEEARSRGKRRLLLGVKADNAAAIAFYEHSGFVRAGTRKFQVGAMLCDDFILSLKL